MSTETADEEKPQYKGLSLPSATQSALPEEIQFDDLDFSTDNLPDWDENNKNLLSPKQALKDFILATVATEDNTSHSFVVPEATTIAHVKKFVHRMRVELSRIRTQIIRNGEKPKQFSTLIKDVEIVADEEAQKIITTVTLSTKITPNVKPEMEELMSALTIEE